MLEIHNSDSIIGKILEFCIFFDITLKILLSLKPINLIVIKNFLLIYSLTVASERKLKTIAYILHLIHRNIKFKFDDSKIIILCLDSKIFI